MPSLELTIDVHRKHYSDGVISKITQNGKPSRAYFETMEPFADIEAAFWLMSASALNLTPDSTALIAGEISAFVSWPGDDPFPDFYLFKADNRSGWLQGSKEVAEMLVGIFVYHSSLVCQIPPSAATLLKYFDDRFNLGPEIVAAASTTPHTALYRILQPQLQHYEGLASAEYDDRLALVDRYPSSLLSKTQRRNLAIAKEQKILTSSKQTTVTSYDLAFNSPHGSYEKLRGKCVWSLEQVTLDIEATAAMSNRLAEQKSISEVDLTTLGALLYKGHTHGVDVQKAAILLCGCMANAPDKDIFCLIVDCLIIILNHHAGAVTQWLIDSIMTGIVRMFSSSALANSWADPGAEYDRLCRLVDTVLARLCRLIGAVLARHRVRLGGRFHLLIPVLSGLLRCFFAPKITVSSSKSDRKFSATLPPWARSSYPLPSSVPNQERHLKESASQFARVLRSIADPSPSAVKTSKNNSLNDETLRARRIAGEYMQYLIAEYTRYCLEGAILPETKEALMPGLYKVLDGMDRDVMRAMNARLDGNQKAIWRALFQDWERFGKWDGK